MRKVRSTLKKAFQMLICKSFFLEFLGVSVIVISIELFEKTELLSLEHILQIIMIGIGAALISNSSKSN